jgi:hypothetical protein
MFSPPMGYARDMLMNAYADTLAIPSSSSRCTFSSSPKRAARAEAQLRAVVPGMFNLSFRRCHLAVVWYDPCSAYEVYAGGWKPDDRRRRGYGGVCVYGTYFWTEQPSLLAVHRWRIVKWARCPCDVEVDVNGHAM